MQRLAILADIDAGMGGRWRERHRSGADECSTVVRPEFWNRESREIDVVAAKDDLIDRRVLFRDMDRRDPALQDVTRGGDHLRGRELRVETDRERIALLAR